MLMINSKEQWEEIQNKINDEIPKKIRHQITEIVDSEIFENDLENNERIIDSCKKSDKIIFAWGKDQTKNDILFRIMEVLKLLEPYKDKIYEISDESGKNGYHPLGASVRLNWILVPFQYPKSETKTKLKKKGHFMSL